MPFLPQGVEPPKTNSLYFRFEQGDNKFRILSDAVVGWVDWTEDKKPIRSKEERPALSADPKKQPKNFWAFKVWDYKEHKVKILEVTQAGIQSSIFDLYKDSSWGDPKGYDINVKRDGVELATKYNIMATPPTSVNPKITEVLQATVCDLEQLFSGGDPFNPQGTQNAPQATTQPISDEYTHPAEAVSDAPDIITENDVNEIPF